MSDGTVNYTAMAHGIPDWRYKELIRAEQERDALKARVEELERQLAHSDCNYGYDKEAGDLRIIKESK